MAKMTAVGFARSGSLPVFHTRQTVSGRRHRNEARANQKAARPMSRRSTTGAEALADSVTCLTVEAPSGGDRVVGFVGYGDRGEEAPNTGEIFAMYVLSEYYGKGVAQQLMKTGLEQLNGYSQICLWVLKENKRAIRFYQKSGFIPDGEELVSPNVGSIEIRMVLAR